MTVTQKYKRKDGVIVPPQSTNSIANKANSLRMVLGLENRAKFPVIEVLEGLHLIIPDFEFEICENHELGEDLGRTYPDKKKILLRESVYEGAGNGDGRDRFTICHEVGHLMMHQNISFSRVDPRSPPELYCNSEWQADKFASHLLMPTHLLADYDNIQKAMIIFGTSYSAVAARLKDMKKV